MGITHGKDKEESNQAAVLSAFDNCGYSVCVQPVCPSKVGVPMTRQRLHYIGLNRDKVKDHALQIERLKAVWAELVAEQYPSCELEAFLDPQTGSGHMYTKSERKAEDQQDRKWRLVHKEIFSAHEAKVHFQWQIDTLKHEIV